jgi:hypothetical protein
MDENKTERLKKYRQKWYQEHKDYYRRYRERHGDCYTPEERKAYHNKYRQENLEKEKARSKRYYQEHREEIRTKSAMRRGDPEKKNMLHLQRVTGEKQLKVEVLTYYGNGAFACVECGESRFPCLSIDHIDGTGADHRRELGLGGGGKFYRWLKKNNYPVGFQTLCMNCQWVKKYVNKEFSKGIKGGSRA